MSHAPTITIDPASVTHYRQRGYAVLRGLLDDAAVRQLRQECDRLWSQADLFAIGTPGVAVRMGADGRPKNDRLDPIIAHSPLLAELARGPLLIAVASAMLGEPAVLFKDKGIFKPPGTSGYGLHQDYAYWTMVGVPAEAMLSVLVAVDPASQANGAMEVYPGYHRHRLPAPAHDPLDVDPAAVDPACVERPDLQAGDMVAFHSLTPHGSDPNRSDTPRRSLFLTYNAARYGDRYQRTTNCAASGDTDANPTASMETCRRESLFRQEVIREPLSLSGRGQWSDPGT
jgi:ectoine hydroxylase-related dioxygenase (phytanoyl-CoA dioxygenase family)